MRCPEVEEGWRVHDYGGVYLLASFTKALPKGPADFLAPHVIYVGEGRHFASRWRQFERSGKDGLPGHSGGHSYRTWARKNQVPWDSLHVAAYPIWFGSEGDDIDAPLSLAHRYRLYREQEILWSITRDRLGKTGLHLLNAK